MFCKKCGKELQPTEKFCSKCGTPVDEAAAPQRQPKQISLTIPPHVKSPMGILYLIVAAFHLLQLVFWTVSTYGSEWLKFSVSFYLSGDGKGFANVFFVFLTVAAFQICVMPILMKTVSKARKMIVPLIANVWALIWVIYVWTEVSLTFCGWLLFLVILFAILAEVFILLVSNKIISLVK